jgi:acetoin utilization protein AcuB
MTANPITVSPDTPAYIAAEMLSTYKYGALPVVDGETLVGIITVTDILEEFISTEKPKSVVGAVIE